MSTHPTPESGQTPRAALLIGVSSTRHASFNPLPGAARDVCDMYGVLRDRCGFEYISQPIFGAKATRQNIHLAIEALPPCDLLFVHVSGHGFETPAGRYLVCHDTDPSNFAGTAIALRELAGWLGKTGCKRVFALDVCRVGNDAEAAPGARSALSTALARDLSAVASCAPEDADYRTSIMLSACKVGQRAWEWEGRGLFTESLVQSIQVAQYPREFTQIAVETSRRTIEACQKLGLQTQTPWLEVSGPPAAAHLGWAAVGGPRRCDVVAPAAAPMAPYLHFSDSVALGSYWVRREALSFDECSGYIGLWGQGAHARRDSQGRLVCGSELAAALAEHFEPFHGFISRLPTREELCGVAGMPGPDGHWVKGRNGPLRWEAGRLLTGGMGLVRICRHL